VTLAGMPTEMARAYRFAQGTQRAAVELQIQSWLLLRCLPGGRAAGQLAALARVGILATCAGPRYPAASIGYAGADILGWNSSHGWPAPACRGWPTRLRAGLGVVRCASALRLLRGRHPAVGCLPLSWLG